MEEKIYFYVREFEVTEYVGISGEYKHQMAVGSFILVKENACRKTARNKIIFTIFMNLNFFLNLVFTFLILN